MISEIVKFRAIYGRIYGAMRIERPVKKIVFLAFLLSVIACGKSDTSSGELSISISKLSFILPGDKYISIFSDCQYGTTISEPRYFFEKVSTTWSGSGNFQPIILKFEIDDSGNMGENTCTLSGADSSDGSLALALGFTSDPIVLPDGTSSLSADSCPIHCGGLTIKNKAAVFRASVKVKLIGVHTDSDNVQKPVSATTTTYIENIPY